MKNASEIFTTEELEKIKLMWELFNSGPERTKVYDNE